MFEIIPVNEDKDILAFKATGKLTDADYKQFLPILEEMIRNTGRISLYIEMQSDLIVMGSQATMVSDDCLVQ